MPLKRKKNHFASFKVLTLTCLHDASHGQVCLYRHLKKFKCSLYIHSKSFISSPRIMSVFFSLHSTAKELCKNHTLPSLMIPSYHPSIHAALPGTILVPFKLSTVISPVTSIPVKTWNSHLLIWARAHEIVFIFESELQTYSNALPRLMWILYLYCYLLSQISE